MRLKVCNLLSFIHSILPDFSATCQIWHSKATVKNVRRFQDVSSFHLFTFSAPCSISARILYVRFQRLWSINTPGNLFSAALPISTSSISTQAVNSCEWSVCTSISKVIFFLETLPCAIYKFSYISTQWDTSLYFSVCLKNTCRSCSIVHCALWLNS